MATTKNGTKSNDSLTADGSDQNWYGLAGNDTLRSGSQLRIGLFGGDGNDTLIGAASDTLDGGAGTDKVQFDASVAGLTDKMLLNVELIEITNTSAGSYNFGLQTEALDITGSDNGDTITGGSGKDVIRGGVGSDSLLGGAGNDSLYVDAADALIDGGTGTDTAYFSANVDTGVLNDFEFKNVENVVIVDGIGTGISLDLSLQTESLQITGAAGGDTLMGGYRADTITGGLGEDVLYGNDGADLFVADGSDSVDGGMGDDTVRYAGAVDSLADDALVNVERIVLISNVAGSYDFSAQSERLNIMGGSGNDTLIGAQLADTLSGGTGNDWLRAQDTDALIDGGSGTDTAEFVTEVSASNLADADLVGIEKIVLSNEAAGAYDFSVQSESLNITGSAYADSITGGKGADSIAGGVGNDTLIGGAGIDWLRGGDGADLLVAEDTDGVIDGGANAVTGVTVERDKVQFAKGVSAKNLLNADMVGIEDVEITNTSTDATYDFSAQTEALSIMGNLRKDLIIGSQDWDTIDGGAGNDTLRGGKGRDDFTVSAGDDTIADLEVRERLGVAEGATATVTGVLDFRLIDVYGDGVVKIGGTPKADKIWGTLIKDYITALEGNDTIDARDGNDTVLAGAGDDSVQGGVGEDSLDGGAGNDTLDGGDDNDTITAGAGNDSVLGGLGNDSLDGGDGNDTLDAGEGDDTVTAGAGNDSVLGGLGNDSLDGGAGNDTIDGGDGDDTLTGGPGTDRLIGGNGVDLFKIVALSDIDGLAETIDGGNDGSTDQIDLGAAGAVNLSLATISNVEVLNLNSGSNVVQVAASQVGTGLSQIQTINGGSGADTLKTADATFNLVGVALSGIESVGTTASGSTTIKMDAADLPPLGGITTVFTGDAAGVDVLETPDAALDVSGVTLTNIDTLKSTNAGSSTIKVGSDQLGSPGITAIETAGAGEVLTDDDTLDVSGVVLTNIDKLTVDANGDGGSPQVITVNPNQIGTGKVTQIGSGNPDAFAMLQMSAPGTLDLSQVTLTNVDSVAGSTGADNIIGSTADDTVGGGPGSDTLDGGAGNNTLSFADITATPAYGLPITGVAVNLSGSAVTEATVWGAMGGTSITLGGAAPSTHDAAALAAGSSAYLVNWTANGTATNSGLGDRDTILNFHNVIGSSLNDYIVGNGVANTITGGAGNDVITGGAGVDKFVVDSGADIVTDVNANDDDDILVVDATVRYAKATVTVVAAAGTNTWEVSAETKNLGGTVNITVADGSVGVNLSAATGDTGYTVRLGSGGDLGTGSSFNDTIYGGSGADTITGNAGDDVLYDLHDYNVINVGDASAGTDRVFFSDVSGGSYTNEVNGDASKVKVMLAVNTTSDYASNHVLNSLDFDVTDVTRSRLDVNTSGYDVIHFTGGDVTDGGWSDNTNTILFVTYYTSRNFYPVSAVQNDYVTYGLTDAARVFNWASDGAEYEDHGTSGLGAPGAPDPRSSADESIQYIHTNQVGWKGYMTFYYGAQTYMYYANAGSDADITSDEMSYIGRFDGSGPSQYDFYSVGGDGALVYAGASTPPAPLPSVLAGLDLAAADDSVVTVGGVTLSSNSDNRTSQTTGLSFSVGIASTDEVRVYKEINGTYSLVGLADTSSNVAASKDLALALDPLHAYHVWFVQAPNASYDWSNFNANLADNLSLSSALTVYVTNDFTAPTITGVVADATSLMVTAADANMPLEVNVAGYSADVASSGGTATLNLSAQDSITTASIQVVDPSGNTKVFNGKVVLGTDAAIGEFLTGHDSSTLTGASGIDFIFGFDGKDTLSGGTGNDFLTGGADDDSLTGGAGADKLVGGLGLDQFVYNTGDALVFTFTRAASGTQVKPLVGDRFVGTEVITDFTATEDAANGDLLVLSANVNAYQGGDGAEVLANSAAFKYGHYDEATGTFVVGDNATSDSSNSDMLALWDGNSAAGIQLEAVVLVGVGIQGGFGPSGEYSFVAHSV